MPEGRSRSAFPQRSSSALTESRGGEYGRRHHMSAQTLLAARRSESRFYTDIADGLRAVCRTDMEALAEMAVLHLRILFPIQWRLASSPELRGWAAKRVGFRSVGRTAMRGLPNPSVFWPADPAPFRVAHVFERTADASVAHGPRCRVHVLLGHLEYLLSSAAFPETPRCRVQACACPAAFDFCRATTPSGQCIEPLAAGQAYFGPAARPGSPVLGPFVCIGFRHGDTL